MKIIVCGSLKFASELVKIYNQLEERGHEPMMHKEVFRIADDSSPENRKESTENKIKYNLIKSYFDLIKSSDAVLVINKDKGKIKNYIGGNSFLEMGFAHILDKKIFLLNSIPKMKYSDEIKALQPIILKGDLNRIS